MTTAGMSRHDYSWYSIDSITGGMSVDRNTAGMSRQDYS